jgi:hypothetical protein
MIDPGTLNLTVTAEHVALASGNPTPSQDTFAGFDELEEDFESFLASGKNLLSLN